MKSGLGVIFRTLLSTCVLIVATSQAVEARSVPVPGPLAPCTKTIDVNLTGQQLVAAECARVIAATPITSGRPGLSTPTGTFAVFLKEQDVTFFSAWPQGDPNYYPPMPVAYAMEFLDGGYYLHTDADEPPSGFGPGSQDGPYASHGCVHVPTAGDRAAVRVGG